MKHWSDCAVHNAPAYTPGECDCGGYPSLNPIPTESTLAPIDLAKLGVVGAKQSPHPTPSLGLPRS